MSVMAALYRRAHAFVLPTRGEGWCLPLLEAMVAGVPAVATAWSGLLEFATAARWSDERPITATNHSECFTSSCTKTKIPSSIRTCLAEFE